MNNQRQVTIEFATAKEAKLFKRWYSVGSIKFFNYLSNSGKWGRKEAKKKIDKWPNRCERFVD